MTVTGGEKDDVPEELCQAAVEVDPSIIGHAGDNADAPDAQEDEYVGSVFAPEPPESAVTAASLRTAFAPWHHPVKQIVRDYQWADLVRKLLDEHRTGDQRDTLRYFTLPGADLLDVRVLADALAGGETKIDYFGFDAGYDLERVEQADATGTYLAAESELRQAGRISDSAEILSDRLEDIARTGSHAAQRLAQRGVFDVVNIDACNHLGYVPSGRDKSIFDALERILAHQIKAERPWLLFVTTRANVSLLGGPTTKLQSAILKNIELHPEFGHELAACIGGAAASIASDMNAHWSKQGFEFLKLFCVGLGKFFLQYYHAQLSLPARVELVSAYAYKVSSDEPDMLSLAFRITPHGLVVQPPSTGGAAVLAPIELPHALAIIARARKLWDLDSAIASDEEVRRDAVNGTRKLLAAANYDLTAWRDWLAELPIRPMQIDEAA
jgi:hypothetical protein